MTRSYSQDVNIPPTTATTNPFAESVSGVKSKAHSDSSLDHPPPISGKSKPIIQKTIKEQPSIGLEEEVCSYDSLVFDEETKKKKRKLFPGFSKKKSKGE